MAARRGEERLVVGGITRADAERAVGGALAATPGVEFAGRLSREDFRALVRRSRAFVAAARREDHGIAQLEALADGTPLVSLVSPGPYAALPIARALDARLVADEGFPDAIRVALDDPRPDYAEAARAALAPLTRASVDAVVRDRLLPALLA
jgi:glycosyltransferase involved in cell wall biosynthesis